MNTAINGLYSRVSLGFSRKIDTDLIAFVRNIITLMTGSTQYPTPSPSWRRSPRRSMHSKSP
jgi:hypothetical protein